MKKRVAQKTKEQGKRVSAARKRTGTSTTATNGKLPVAVVDLKGARAGEQVPVVKRTGTIEDAEQYIGTLPGAETGRYSIDAPEHLYVQYQSHAELRRLTTQARRLEQSLKQSQEREQREQEHADRYSRVLV